MTQLFGSFETGGSKGRDAETAGQEKARVLQELKRGKEELKEFVQDHKEALIEQEGRGFLLYTPTREDLLTTTKPQKLRLQ